MGENAIDQKNWPQQKEWDVEKYGMPMDSVLEFGSVYFEQKEAGLYKNGVVLKKDRASSIENGKISSEYYWVRDTNENILGLALVTDVIKSQFNLSSV
mgnify:FL=1